MVQADKWSVKISLTDRCNFRCEYCIQLPQILSPSNSRMTIERIGRLLENARNRGITKVLWTGGEPTMGPLLQAARRARELGFEEQGITSNGFLLNRMFEDLVDAGLTRANISIDSLDRRRFYKITSADKLNDVLESIEKAASVLDTVKINMVVMRNNIDEIPAFLSFVANYRGRLILKLHEMWKTDPIEIWERLYVPADEIFAAVEQCDDAKAAATIKATNPGVIYYELKKHGITVGLARMPASHMCEVKACTKLRLYANGKTCEGRDIFRSEAWDDEFAELMEDRHQALIENNKELGDFI